MNKKGFTLIELLIVIAIIGIVAAIAVPNLLTALQKGKLKATMGDMKTIGTIIYEYATDNAMVPGGAAYTIVADMEVDVKPFYIQVLPTKDGWGSSLNYNSGAAETPQQLEYSLTSYGRDTIDSSPDITQSEFVSRSLDGFDHDIVYSNGGFTYAPKQK